MKITKHLLYSTSLPITNQSEDLKPTESPLFVGYNNYRNIAKDNWGKVLKRRKEGEHAILEFRKKIALSQKRNKFRHSKKMHIVTFYKECHDDIEYKYLFKFFEKWIYDRRRYFSTHFLKELKFFYVNKRRKVWKPRKINLSYLWILTEKRVRRRRKKTRFQKFTITHCKKFRRYYKGLSIKTIKREGSYINKIYSSAFQNFMFRFERRMDVLGFRLHFFPSIKIAQWFVKFRYVCVNKQNIRYKSVFLKHNQIFSIRFDFRFRMLAYLLNKIKRSRSLFNKLNFIALKQRSLIWYNFPVYLEVNWRLLSCVLVQQHCIYMYKTVPLLAHIHPNIIFNHVLN